MKDPLLENFLKHSGKVMEYGFAYIYANPEHIAEMNNLLQIIRDFQAVQYRHSSVPTFCKQLILDGYIDYIRRVTKFGFKYICNHPEVMADVQELSIFYNEFDETNNQRRQSTTFSNHDDCDESENDDEEGEEFFEICFNELNQLQSIIQSFESKMNQKIYSNYPSFTATTKVLKNFNKKLEDELQNSRRHVNYQTPETLNTSSAKTPGNYSENSFQSSDLPSSTPKHKEAASSCSQNDQLKPIPQYNLESSSESFESVVHCENCDEFIQTNNSQSIPTFKIHPPEKHIYIPIETNNNDQQYFPIITTEFTFTKPNQHNQMQMNVRLGFKDGFQFQDKFINEINIHHKLPHPSRDSRMKHDIK